MSIQTLTILLAGGKGTRLEPLTHQRAKPAVPFGGGYRIVDFPLSNCINSGLFQVLVLTQYKSLSLDRHIERAWSPLFQRELGAFLELIPPQQRVTEEWYRGTADAVFQNIYSINATQPENVLILAGDHIYAMDYRTMLAFHRSTGADVTIGTYRVPVDEAANQFGVFEVDEKQRVVGFEEKPDRPRSIPHDEGHALASMGIYVFKTKFLLKQLEEDAAIAQSGHDFGRDILTRLGASAHMYSFPFHFSRTASSTYWRDVGTLDAYFDANLDLLQTKPPLVLDNEDWPIRSFKPNLPPPTFLSSSRGIRDVHVDNSLVASGCKVIGASLTRSVLGHRCVLEPGCALDETILLGDSSVGEGAQIRRTILDKDVRIPAKMSIGFDPEEDASRGFAVSPRGVTVVPRGYRPV